VNTAGELLQRVQTGCVLVRNAFGVSQRVRLTEVSVATEGGHFDMYCNPNNNYYFLSLDNHVVFFVVKLQF
jgi:hypothetical protein